MRVDVRRPVVARIVAQALNEDLHQVLEGMALGIDQGALEEGAGRKGLDRLQEAAIAGIVDELPDRGVASLDLQGGRAELADPS